MKTFRKISILFLLVNLVNFGASNIEGKIAQIRKDFASTNAAKNYVIKEVEDPEQSTDGGVVKYFSQNGIVKKIVVEHDKRKSKFSEQRYYFDENEKLIRYIGENKKVVENRQKLKEIEKEILNEYYRIKN